MRYSHLVLVCASLSLLFSGCIFSPHRGGGGGTLPPPVYQVNQFPEVVLQNLAQAYAHRDSTEYKSLYDENYQGSSLDNSNPSPQLLTYTKADEAQHIAGLAKNATITSVDLQLKPELVRLTDAGDPPGWALIQNPIFSLTIFDSPTTWQITVEKETNEFHFIPKTPDSSSPTDTTWKIVKWLEIR